MKPQRILPLILLLLLAAPVAFAGENTNAAPKDAEAPDSSVMHGYAVFTGRRHKAMTDIGFSARLPEDCLLTVNFEDIFHHRGDVYEEHSGSFSWKPCETLRLGIGDVVCRTKKDVVEDPNVTEWRTSNLTRGFFTLNGALGSWRFLDRNLVEYRECYGYGTDLWRYRNRLWVTAPKIPVYFADIVPYAHAEIYWSDNDAFKGEDKWNTFIYATGFRAKLTETLRLNIYYKSYHYRRTTDDDGGWRCTRHEPYFAISAAF